MPHDFNAGAAKTTISQNQDEMIAEDFGLTNKQITFLVQKKSERFGCKAFAPC
jgi:hypothetical protein